MKFKPVTIHIQDGDIITSKKGMLQNSEITDKWYMVTKAKYRGNNCWEALEKEELKKIKESKKEKKK